MASTPTHQTHQQHQRNHHRPRRIPHPQRPRPRPHLSQQRRPLVSGSASTNLRCTRSHAKSAPSPRSRFARAFCLVRRCQLPVVRNAALYQITSAKSVRAIVVASGHPNLHRSHTPPSMFKRVPTSLANRTVAVLRHRLSSSPAAFVSRVATPPRETIATHDQRYGRLRASCHEALAAPASRPCAGPPSAHNASSRQSPSE